MPTTVVLGSGIIGLSTAFYLAQSHQPHRVHLVYPSPVLFASASGKAAGFLAKDWFAPALAPLGALSFDLHRALARAHAGRARWGWSESVSYSLDRHDEHDERDETRLDGGGEAGDGGRGGDWLLSDASRATVVEGQHPHVHTQALDPESPTWLRARPSALQAISDRSSTGQVHPLRLCEFLLEQCLAAGVALHHPARATRLLRADPADPSARALLRLELLAPHAGADTPPAPARTLDIPCDNVVIAAGCWTPQVYSTLFPHAPRAPRISALAGHSVVLRSKHWPPPPPAPGPGADTDTDTDTDADADADADAPCHAVFTSDRSGFSPELFSRAGGDVWLGGLNTRGLALPAHATDARARSPPRSRASSRSAAACAGPTSRCGARACASAP
ncbi:hypothetical protein AcW1_004922 [Taiwanofungus camphoratus]|nr:hypothetical protein AcW1_004922 [Antrodia cinnamomea]